MFQYGTTVQTLQASGVEVKLIGDPTCLQRPLLGLFCSQKCPGELILKAFDLAKELRDQRIPVISGFHSSMEKEILPILMRGVQPVLICLARELEHYQIPSEYTSSLNDGRLLLVSPFSGMKFTRITKDTSTIRNQLVADLSTAILLIHAEPGGRIDKLRQKWVAEQKEVFALRGKSNRHLFESGVKEWENKSLVS